mmetsp:Transcript_18781/g.23308  ORF Transcript_18781/g.23308 Transcript_18781/m.23308 type:complete len:235 (-) Transcript_18781:390-1094(-)|eukprot:CAMPEP_0172509752 /NCGR_PEP_ID=MMETSP1066-20121228/222783_1 /TAXON_ID=671091 /ORGANISM="Coscinodiscus wailesii, Strain CCMP2513" /LENGTH=234 /DNA_ID=CAMNT_0013288389 /DNA_START=42 /DNA_END=746 /DNA_ORIENTATION=+
MSENNTTNTSCSATEDPNSINSAALPASRGNQQRWSERVKYLTMTAEKGNVDLVFIGDSITNNWIGCGKHVWKKYYGDRKPLNLGIGGDRTEHVIWRLMHGNLGNIRPKVAVLMIGTNNTGQLKQNPVEVASGIARILEILEEYLPETKVILHGIFPRGVNSLDVNRVNNIAINQLICNLADGDRVHYMDISDHFLEPDGSISHKIMRDYVHLSPHGYQRWAQALEPKLQELGL